ncbi:hypothetical protein NESM_000485300 [Novymonas esmeraldas]|uniref:Uncharacterized protein n=1 Tax=Novymonas esmeraldas TaxID=1808958 RepID=A0AAW0EPC6_9TRYP
MQRDAYASIVRYRNLHKTPLRILQMNGAVFHENVSSSFFRGYHARRIALMTHTAGQDPRLPRLSKDIIVTNYETLRRIHQPHFMYRLLPLHCADAETFAAMQSICASPGSPFTLEDRVDAQSLNFRMSKMCAGRDKVCDFFKEYTSPEELNAPTATRELPVTSVMFQGLLVHRGVASLTTPEGKSKGTAESPSSLSSTLASGSNGGTPAAPAAAAVAHSGPHDPHKAESCTADASADAVKHVTRPTVAFVTTHNTLNEKVLLNRHLMTSFFESPVCIPFYAGAPIALSVRFMQNRMHFMAVKSICAAKMDTVEGVRLRAHLLNMASKYNFYVYEKVGEGEYAYATAAGAAGVGQ